MPFLIGGTRFRACPTCRGKGKVSITCPACNGQGSVHDIEGAGRTVLAAYTQYLEDDDLDALGAAMHSLRETIGDNES